LTVRVADLSRLLEQRSQDAEDRPVRAELEALTVKVADLSGMLDQLSRDAEENRPVRVDLEALTVKVADLSRVLEQLSRDAEENRPVRVELEALTVKVAELSGLLEHLPGDADENRNERLLLSSSVTASQIQISALQDEMRTLLPRLERASIYATHALERIDELRKTLASRPEYRPADSPAERNGDPARFDPGTFSNEVAADLRSAMASASAIVEISTE
jgi:chromosome segregation ATPase